VADGVALRIDAADDLPAVMADPAQLDQILVNLLLNASEACGEGGEVASDVGLAETPLADAAIGTLENRRYLCVRVWDNGCGIAPEHRSRIFDPFFTTKFSGRGLGLAVTQRLVRAHGGAIAVESEPGRGTRIDVYLPAIPKAHEGVPRAATSTLSS